MVAAVFQPEVLMHTGLVPVLYPGAQLLPFLSGFEPGVSVVGRLPRKRCCERVLEHWVRLIQAVVHMGDGIRERKGSAGIHMGDGPEDPDHHIGSNFLIVVQIGKRPDLWCIPVQGEAHRPNSEGLQLINGQVHREVGARTGHPVQGAITRRQSPPAVISSISGS